MSTNFGQEDPDSDFEELDLDKEPQGEVSHLRELLLGLLIVLVVGGWAGWDWWQGQNGLTNYRRATEAAANHDWEAARDYYLAAGNYSDAPTQAQTADRNIADRDAHYRDGVAASGAGDWPVALRELQTLKDLAPGYRDSDSLFASAEHEVYTEALSGTVALRSNASPPGLYLRTADNWIWLQDSDANSSVRVSDNCGYVVYDAPGGVASTTDGTGGQDPNAWKSGLAGRRLMAVRLLNGLPQITRFAFDPAAFTSLYCLKSGLLAGRIHLSYMAGDTTPGGTGALWDGLFFQQLGRTDAKAIGLSYGQNLMDIVPGLDELLLAQVDRDTLGGVHTRYSLLNLLDGKVDNISSQEGLPIRADVSPDGGQAIIYDYNPLPSASQQTGPNRYAIKVIDLKVKQWTNYITAGSYGPELFETVDYNAQFLTSGPHKGDILLLRGRDNPRAWLLAGTYPFNVLWSEAGPQGRQATIGVPFAGGLLLSWSDPYCQPPDRGGLDTLVTYVDPAYRSTSLDLGIGPVQYVEDARTSGSQLVYTAAERCWIVGKREHTIGSLELGNLDASGVKPLNLNSTSDNDASDRATVWAAGPGLLAYIAGDQLRARTYSGGPEVILEPDVKALYQVFP